MGTVLTNSQIADRLATLAQLLAAGKTNPYKVKAYRRVASTLRSQSESFDELVHNGEDLTRFPGIGEAISSAIREIVLTGTLQSIENLRTNASPELLALAEYPKLDPKRILRVFKKLNISSIDSLRHYLDSGEIERTFGVRMAEHIQGGLSTETRILLYRAHDLSASIKKYLTNIAGVRRVAEAGDYRRRVEVIEELVFVVETTDFKQVINKLQRFGGHTEVIQLNDDHALLSLPSGPRLRIARASERDWGYVLLRETGSATHLSKLEALPVDGLEGSLDIRDLGSEEAVYECLHMHFIEPEIREGRDEVQRAKAFALPELVREDEIRGDLHAHTIASDGSHSIEQMARQARERGYEYLGITDHSQSLKIAGGVSIDDLWKQIALIDKVNDLGLGIRVLKSAEVDILADGTLDYPDEVLRELDYTVCSIHSRFGLNREQQTERVIRAMDNPYFTILGHATGRLLLKRPGYDLDFDRIVLHARDAGRFFEINSSPDRLDLSANNARLASEAGVLIAISTDAHSMREFGTIQYGIEQARRAGLDKTRVLNCQPLAQLLSSFTR